MTEGRSQAACDSHGDVGLCLDCRDGRWAVKTASGTTYVIDVTGEWIERHPRGVAPLRRHGDRLRLLGLTPVVVGEPLRYAVDVLADGATYTSRQSTEVVSVDRVDADQSAGPVRADRSAKVPRDEAPGLVYLANGVLTNVHPASACADQPWGCWIHRPRDHALAHAPVMWRADKQTAERICDHGIGHPDPQDAAYNWNVLGRDVSVHGCDGCCGPGAE